MKRLILLIFTLAAFALPAAAQEEDFFARYADIPHSRTEDGGFVLGDPDAPVTIVEFADFMCPHCQDYHATVTDFIDEYVASGQAKLEYRFFPIVHPQYSTFTAQIAECVEVQRDGGFWAAHDVIYDLSSNGQIGPDTPETVAELTGIDAEKLEACIPTAVQHETDTALGDSVGVSGTPAVLIRAPDGALGWAYISNRVMSSGGLPMPFLAEIMAAPDLAEMMIVPMPLLSDLVTESDCEAACWRSIIPGETLFSEVADLIRADRRNIEINVQDATDEQTGAVSWRTFDSVLDDANYIVEGSDGTVEIISLLDLSSYGLGDVMEIQGEPELALAVPNGESSALFYGIYTEKSLIVLGFVQAEAGLTPETVVIGAQYFSPSAMAELLAEGELAEWTGFDGLTDYLRQ